MCLFSRSFLWWTNLIAICFLLRFILEKGCIHELVIGCNHFEDLLLTALNDVAADDHFFENEIGLVEIEDEVQLANIAEVLVEHFYKMVNNVKHNQLIVLLLDARHEVQ